MFSQFPEMKVTLTQYVLLRAVALPLSSPVFEPEPLIICLILLCGNLQCLFSSTFTFYCCLSSFLPSCCSVVAADVCPGCWMKTSTSSPSLSSLVMCMLLQLTSSLSFYLLMFFPSSPTPSIQPLTSYSYVHHISFSH